MSVQIRPKTNMTKDEQRLAMLGAVVDLAQGVHSLIQNPSVLKQLGLDVASSNSLNEEEIKAREEAIELIKKSEEKVELKKTVEAEISQLRDNFSQDCERKVSGINQHAKNQEENIAILHKELDNRKGKLDTMESNLEQIKKDLDIRSAALDARESDLDEQAKTIKRREDAASAKETRIEGLKQALAG